ncbi:MAG: hypothetical protein OXC42_07760 [Gammaproteobacteria bacterium]|nr:hypothetical protein [Gammaproteobacteria bacterium]
MEAVASDGFGLSTLSNINESSRYERLKVVLAGSPVCREPLHLDDVSTGVLGFIP